MCYNQADLTHYATYLFSVSLCWIVEFYHCFMWSYNGLMYRLQSWAIFQCIVDIVIKAYNDNCNFTSHDISWYIIECCWHNCYPTKRRLISLLMHAKFEGNTITRLHFMAVFLQVCEKKKRKYFLKAYILGMADMIYFKSGMCSLPICQHLHSEFDLVWSRDHRATNMRKIVLCSLC